MAYRKQGNTLSLESVPFSGGRFVSTTTSSGTTYRPDYFITDHLGSVRLVVDETGNILEQNDYYPFGLRWNDPASTRSDNRYGYNAKEWQGFLNIPYNDHGARMLEPRYRLSWGGPDVLAEKYSGIGSYVFCAGNPVKYVDMNGMYWAYYSIDGIAEPTWNWVDDDHYNTGVKDSNGNEVVLPAYETVVTFEGSRNEKLGAKVKDTSSLYIDGDGAVTAKVTVYGPRNADDIATYTGFTMSSDFKIYGAIANGEYDVNYLVPGKQGGLPSNYAVSNRRPVDCLDGRNPSPIDPYSLTQKSGIYIHATNRDGKASGRISTGCLLIQGGTQWELFKKQIGPRDFRLILNRK